MENEKAFLQLKNIKKHFTEKDISISFELK